MRTIITAPKELVQIFEQLGHALDISEEQHNAIVKSYQAVAEWLSAPDSILSPYKPEIAPQGSFLLGTMIPGTRPGVEIDIDLVCKLLGKSPTWTQLHLKKIVGDRLKAHATYLRMLGPEGRRCWTLHYSESANFHLDVLAAIVANDYEVVIERTLALSGAESPSNLGIRITDNTVNNYRTETSPERWPSSNPFGYAVWFHNLAKRDILNTYSLRDVIKSIPDYQSEKTPLQRVVQLLKWHRDQHFADNAEKPISIIITTLAARGYEKERDVFTALTNIAGKLIGMVENRFDPITGRWVKWVPNPVNPAENFADKWAENPKLEQNFESWVRILNNDLDKINQQVGFGSHKIKGAMEGPFGSRMVTKAFENYGNKLFADREKGILKMSVGTGLISEIGRTPVTHHNKFGANE